MSDKLFDLIESMSQIEKKHFSNFASMNVKNKETDYLKLYKMIEKGKKYDEAKIKKSFKGNLSSKKNRLTHKILESLNVMYADKKLETELKQCLNFISILFDKKQFKELVSQLRTAKTKALKCESFLILIELVDWEKKILIEQSPKNLEEQYLNLIEEESKYITALTEVKAFENLHRKLNILLYKDTQCSKPESKKQLLEYYESDLLQKPQKNILSDRSKYYYCRCISAINIRLKDFEKALQFSEMLVELVEKSYLKEDRQLYKQGLCNLLTCCSSLKKRICLMRTIPSFES